jgi:hypothetical protein
MDRFLILALRLERFRVDIPTTLEPDHDKTGRRATAAHGPLAFAARLT